MVTAALRTLFGTKRHPVNAPCSTLLLILFAGASAPVTAIAANGPEVVPAQSESGQPAAGEQKKEPSPQEKMARRWPQPARVGDLIGDAVVDDADSVIGHVRHIARTSGGDVQFIVSYGGLLGWGDRLVAVPIEAIALIGPFVAPLDFKREQFLSAPTWVGDQSTPLPDDETIRVGITRR